jgi:hypothetical protein
MYMRVGLATTLQAFSLALRCVFGHEFCETMDFYPFFRINKKKGDNVINAIASLVDQCERPESISQQF